MSSTTPQRQRVLVFTTPTCSWCTRVKAYLKERRVPFREVDITKDPNAARDLTRRTGQTGVPVVQIGSKLIVGFDKPRIDQALGLRATSH